MECAPLKQNKIISLVNSLDNRCRPWYETGLPNLDKAKSLADRSSNNL